MSAESLYAADKAIRGGVPVIFPWFGPRAGDPASPAHGFARTREWQVESTTSLADGAVEIVLTLRDDAKTRTIWPHPFVLHYHVRVGKTLELTLRADNPGPGELTFEEALHTYFGVGDIRRAAVSGLEGTSYIDKVEKFAVKAQGSSPVTITGETDRVYINTRSTCVLQDPAGGRTIEVAKENSNSTVVWNPWSEKSKAMADFGDEEWLNMICVETCNVGDARVTLPAGGSHAMRCVIAAKP
jgi:D-hexose-6-phosphate mutarotase